LVEAREIAPDAAISEHARIEGKVRIGGVVIGPFCTVGPDVSVGPSSVLHPGGSHALVGMDASVQEDLEDGAIARAPQPAVGRRPADGDLTGIGFGYRRKP
jgi:UDP-3-O-[3-hydroxymyristoyl] glucosamine N-acyltransferase